MDDLDKKIADARRRAAELSRRAQAAQKLVIEKTDATGWFIHVAGSVICLWILVNIIVAYSG